MRKMHDQKTIYDFRNIDLIPLEKKILPNLCNVDGSIKNNNGIDLYYIDKEYKDILYNFPYKNNNKNCLGEDFIVIDRFLGKKNNTTGKRSCKVKLFFLQSRTLLTISISKFYKKDIYDPYFRFMLNGACCIGNIIIPDNENSFCYKIHLLWKEIMNRCFNLNYITYRYFGENCWYPAFFDWTCFEFFYSYMISARQAYLSDEDFFTNIGNPNDIFLYSCYGKVSENDIRTLMTMPYSNHIKTSKLSIATQSRPIPQRATSFYYPEIKRGRIEGSTYPCGYNQSDNLVDGKKKMYRLINRGW